MTNSEKIELSNSLAALARRFDIPMLFLGASDLDRPSTLNVHGWTLALMREALESLAMAIDHAEFVAQKLAG